MRFRQATILTLTALACAVVPAGASADTSVELLDAAQSRPTGGLAFHQTNARVTGVVAGLRARRLRSGLAAAPAGAPVEVQRAIWAANAIVGKPYRYGGGHRRFRDSGYDCSGTVSFALHGAGALDSPLDSSSFMSWGERGRGDWITVYTNPGHAYVVIAGLRLDTSAAGDPRGGKGPRWRPALRSTRGFRARHPAGF